jgi:hypothetical protein
VLCQRTIEPAGWLKTIAGGRESGGELGSPRTTRIDRRMIRTGMSHPAQEPVPVVFVRGMARSRRAVRPPVMSEAPEKVAMTWRRSVLLSPLYG